jgi:hypothetical protein
MADAAHNFPCRGTIQKWRRDRGYGEIKDVETGTCYLAALAGNKGQALASGISLDGTPVRFRIRSSYQPVEWIPTAKVTSNPYPTTSALVPSPVREVPGAMPPADTPPLPARPIKAIAQTSQVHGFELYSAFYHITHHRNLPRIFKHGILSWTKAHAQGLTEIDISDPSVQQRRARCEPVYHRSIHDYAPLYFNPRNAMLYVRRHLQHELVILKVSPDVLRQHEHVFSDGNAACLNTKFSADREIVAQSDTALCASIWSAVQDGKRRCCAEVLVFPMVKVRFITAAICSNKNLVNAIRGICPVPIVIDITVFY